MGKDEIVDYYYDNYERLVEGFLKHKGLEKEFQEYIISEYVSEMEYKGECANDKD